MTSPLLDANVTDRAAQPPMFLYGTAWKEDDTQRLVELAIQQGFRGIDTANQRKHYFEAAVGDGIAAMINRGVLTRQDLFLQTKFTFQPGQDHRLPYDPASAIAQQVEQSFASSLSHLQTDYVDSYVLHGPMYRTGLSVDDWAAWGAMEQLHRTGQARSVGISNVGLDQLRLLCDKANVAPGFVQNRCYAARGWDKPVRDFCRANDVVYQGFSLLTANAHELAHPTIRRIAQHHQRTVNQIVFRFAIDIGMLPLTGTTNSNHMQQDLAIADFHLSPDELQQIENLAQ